MIQDFLYNLLIFIGICILIYFIFRNIGFKEGLETATTSDININNGETGGASTYGANIKAQVIKLQDLTLISKYRADYENIVINMDDLVNNLMLQTTLNIDQTKLEEGLEKLVKLNNSKAALNNVMKFIDKT
jgi:hypothetical protein